jgi:D-alanyl-D-alanine dipeptidase
MNEPQNHQLEPRLVSISDSGLLGSSFYWNRYADYGLTRAELEEVGMTSDEVCVSPEIIPLLIKVDEELQKRGWRLYLREGYRSEKLYKLLYQKRIEKFGQEITDKLLNIKDMPHASGKAVDVTIWDDQSNSEVRLRKIGDGPESLIRGFYSGSSDADGQRCHELQEYLINLMLQSGFRLGVKNEFFHFNYQLDI